MGNIQCGSPTESSPIIDRTAASSTALPNEVENTSVQPIPYSKMIQLEQQFLKVHLSEPKKKCIVSTPDVIQAHVEQVEEFIRRSNIMNGKKSKGISLTTDESTISDVDFDTTNDTDNDDTDENESHDGISIGFHSVNSFARITSYFAPTVVSAATEKAGNKHHRKNQTHHHKNNNNSSSSRRRKYNSSDNSHRKRHNSPHRRSAKETTTMSQQNQPRIVGGMEFVESETKRKKIQTIIMEFFHQSWFQRSIYFISPSSKTSTTISTLSTTVGRNWSACHHPMIMEKMTKDENNSTTTNSHSPSSHSFTEQVETYSSILHLRMKMKCYNYFQLHVLRRKPYENFTQNIQKGIIKSSSTTSSYTPQSFQQHLQLSRSYQMKQRGGKSSKSHHSCHKFIIPDLREVSSGDDSSSTGSPSGLDFGIGPPSNPIQLLVTNTVFIDLAITGTLGLNPKKQRIRAAYVDRKVLLSPDDHIVLLNRRSGIPIAVCTMATSITSQFPVVRMYATKRRVPNQFIATTTGKLGLTWTESLPLYTWAEFVTETLDPADPVPTPQSYSIYYVSDSDDGSTLESTPKYRAQVAVPIGTNSTNGGTILSSPMIKIVGRTSREFQSSGCATISMCADDTNDHDRSSNSTDAIFWKLSISQGIDPAVFICFNAFIDELLERTMRWHCENKMK